ncbi:MAG: acyl-ACP--UDP-N-acetylglucosamine O-acyltransferase [Rhizobiaceae bacterium]|nr:acyl-ACP--UDP-N-acetylglucosamine O-acyltransferase [Rhizobiaceae bacterium]
MSASTFVHPSAVVEPGARIGEGSQIGPFCHIGPDVVLGRNTRLLGSVVVTGVTTIGDNATISPTAVVGGQPQNHAHKGGRTKLTIGRNVMIREGVTLHVGSDSSRGETLIGDDCSFFAYSHVAHDCVVGNHVLLTNGATLGGHCELGDNVIVGGLTAVHQFVRVGRAAFLGGCSAIVGDVIPFGMATGNRAKLRGFNIIGMKRAGVARSEILAMRAAYRLIFDPNGEVAQNLAKARIEFAASPKVMEIVDFLSARGKRPFIVPPLGAGADDDGDVAD